EFVGAYDNLPGGSIDVQEGELALSNGGEQESTTLTVADGALLSLEGTPSHGLTGTITGTGEGTARFTSGRIDTRGTGASLDMAEGLFEWTGGTIVSAEARPLVNLGEMTLTGTADKGNGGHIRNEA